MKNITSQELRQKFLNFFKNHPKYPHSVIPSAPLVPSEEEQLEGKEKVLFTSAGMQPLIPYLTGKKDPPARRLVDVQKCLRTDDIEEVGDEVHHTFFEMLGNWSIGDYWKKEAIEMSFEFLTKELGIPVGKLAVSVFEGDEDAPRDEESAKAWKDLGILENRIYYFGKEHNWWPTARREQDSGEYKNPFGPCGPDTEMFYWTGEEEPTQGPDKDPKWVEIWNDVFMQFNRKEDGILEDLPQKNVDTGMGLERTVAILNEKKNSYETDLFSDLYDELREEVKKIETLNNVRTERIRKFLDYSRAAVFLISEGVKPGKNYGEAVLRRLIRNATDQLTTLQNDSTHTESSLWWDKAFKHFCKRYKSVYKFDQNTTEIIKEEIKNYGENTQVNAPVIARQISLDDDNNRKILKQNAQKYLGIPDENIFLKTNTFSSLASVAAGSVAFDAKSTLGFPIQGFGGTASIAEDTLGNNFNLSEFNKTVNVFQVEHQKKSRSDSENKFKGGLAGHSEVEIKYHTATHLLHQALRDVLGDKVFQKGSNITPERLRFDFSFERKMTEEEIKQVEDLVNQKIKEDLKVDKLQMSVEEAYQKNAIGLFNDKYAKTVNIYAIGPDYTYDPNAKDSRDRAGYYSLEFCGGPHVEHTGQVGKIRITKEESISQGVRRIRAELS